MTRCEFAHDDGAYVLGALAPAERAAYERHLAGCAACREAVAEIAVLPGLLGRLDPAGLEQFLEVGPEASRVPALLDAARQRRRRERSRSRRRYALTALAAAVLAVLAGLGAAQLRPPAAPPSPQVPLVAMRPVAGSVPVHAEIGLTDTAWGTEVTMHCGYDRRAGHREAYTFRLVAHGPDGATEQIGSWLAAPGDDLRFTGVTHFTRGELVGLELLRADDTPVLAYDLR
ncbi:MULTISPECIES: anti-sigma factor [Micromonospora]|uniref:Zf-HC2 domain-containing protein n=1 Tax=Micromonospora solifontis TaxID=2487138 RepID=A0ABX9WMN4_9ACTN|nr:MULTISPECIES: zf-HC2 domain-containing protein [Micromonospora]NES13298.1 zf-HC2 domain-containing protein [Micromonospora sp. PPF5-17B]NES34667.1 zf-HC2 domain-containing protein [Micromonospora solifontis]NES57183.1 zf-HC2 domain-containing protein [Micromonospora sp. PPF5-6]RNM01908.1 zf-HC2 domain-containing protein [Micromonospora solifontis]